MKKENLIVTVAILLITIQAVAVRAAWGDWDPTFAGGLPSLHADTDLFPRSVAIQPDGKILVTGYRRSPISRIGARQMFLLRYLPDGSVDTNFGRNGFATFSRRGPFEFPQLRSSSEGERIALLPDGDIAVSGRAGRDYAVWRFSEDGVAVMRFGAGGVSKLDYPVTFWPSKIAVQGEKLIVGVVSGPGSTAPLVVIRLDRNGRQDSVFGNSGEVNSLVLGQTASMLVETESGKITIGGLNRAHLRLQAERLMPDGENDPSFFADHDRPGNIFVTRDLLRLSNEKYVFALDRYQSAFDAPPHQTMLAIMDTLGGLESQFVFHFEPFVPTVIYAPGILAEQSDGKVIASGHGTIYVFNSALDPGSAQICDCDPSFIDFSSMTSAVLQPDNKMVAAARQNGTGNLALIRTLPPTSIKSEDSE
ncbi:MAG: delta-60 repeat domain-containing protein [Pyrinomonadaceae bacterium]